MRDATLLLHKHNEAVRELTITEQLVTKRELELAAKGEAVAAVLALRPGSRNAKKNSLPQRQPY
jgi:hypothetical protein